MGSESPFTRRDLLARLGECLDHLIDKKFKESVQIWPDDKPIPMGDGTFVMPADLEIISVPTEEPVMAINIQERLNKLKTCPVCGEDLTFYPDDPQTRNCECGSFRITEVHTNGDVVFEFHLLAEEGGPRP